MEEELSTAEKDGPLIDMFVNPMKKEDKKNVIKSISNQAKDYFKKSDMTKLYPNLFKLLWYSALPCSTLPELSTSFMLKSCQLAGEKIECSKIFTKVPSDSGMCCGLNVESNLQQSMYSDLVQEMEDSRDFTGNKKEEEYNSETYIGVGLKNGLKLVLDMHSNYESFGTVLNDFHAFQVFLGQPSEFPSLKERALLVQPGLEHFLDISSKLFSASDISDLKPQDRHCFFEDERKLDLYSNYTSLNCRLECLTKLVADNVSCVPWYLPHLDSYPVCDPWTERTFSKRMTEARDDPTSCSHCLPDCQMEKFSVLPSSAQFR